MDWSINYLIRVRVSIHSPLTLHEDKADNKLKVSSAATTWVSVGAPLTVRRPRTKLIGSFQHVLAQQLCVGPPGGKLLIQLVIDELLYPRTWITGDTEIVVKLSTSGEKLGCARLIQSSRSRHQKCYFKMAAVRTFVWTSTQKHRDWLNCDVLEK